MIMMEQDYEQFGQRGFESSFLWDQGAQNTDERDTSAPMDIDRQSFDSPPNKRPRTEDGPPVFPPQQQQQQHVPPAPFNQPHHSNAPFLFNTPDVPYQPGLMAQPETRDVEMWSAHDEDGELRQRKIATGGYQRTMNARKANAEQYGTVKSEPEEITEIHTPASLGVPLSESTKQFIQLFYPYPVTSQPVETDHAARVAGWTQVTLNVVYTLVLLLFLLASTFLVVRDVQHGIHDKVREYNMTVAQCQTQWDANGCNTTTAPALKEICVPWGECLKGERKSMGYSEVGAGVFGKMIQAFVSNMTPYTIVFGTFILFVINLSLSKSRREHTKAAPPPAPYPPAPFNFAVPPGAAAFGQYPQHMGSAQGAYPQPIEQQVKKKGLLRLW